MQAPGFMVSLGAAYYPSSGSLRVPLRLLVLLKPTGDIAGSSSTDPHEDNGGADRSVVEPRLRRRRRVCWPGGSCGAPSGSCGFVAGGEASGTTEGPFALLLRVLPGLGSGDDGGAATECCPSSGCWRPLADCGESTGG